VVSGIAVSSVFSSAKATGINLAGNWSGTGYSCETGPLTEQVQISINQDNLVATKITGDDCVPAGNTTFQGTVPDPVSVGTSFPVTFTVGNPSAPASGTSRSTLTVLTADSFVVNGGASDIVTFNSSVPEPLNILGATTGLALFGTVSTTLKKRKVSK